MADFSISMLSLNLAMEIKPADIPQGSSESTPRASAPPEKAESFNNVLDRVQKDSEPARDTSISEGNGKPQVSRNDEKTDDSLTDQPAGGTSPAPVDDSPELKETAGPATSQSSPDDGNSSGKPEQVGTIDSVAVQGQSLSAMLRDFISGQIVDLAQPGDPSAPVSGTVAAPVQSGSVVDGLGVPAPAGTGLPQSGDTLQQADINSPTVETVTRPIISPIVAVPLVAEPVAGEPVITPADLTGNSVSNSRQPLPSEWTEILDFNRLLNPTFERDTVRQPRTAEPSPVRPETVDTVFRREASDVSRFSDTTRFQTEPQSGKSFDPLALFTGGKPDPGTLTPIIRETGILYHATYRPPVEIAPETSSAANAGTAPASAIQAKPAAMPGASTTAVKFDAEAIVSDVRQVMMRIAADGSGVVKIVLHPPELGELVVRLESARNGVVRAEFHTISPLVREALEAGLNKLTQALESEGLTLAQADVFLNQQFGAEGNSSNTGSESGNQGSLNDPGSDLIADDAMLEPPMFVERLPEGSTISIFA